MGEAPDVHENDIEVRKGGVGPLHLLGLTLESAMEIATTPTGGHGVMTMIPLMMAVITPTRGISTVNQAITTTPAGGHGVITTSMLLRMAVVTLTRVSDTVIQAITTTPTGGHGVMSMSILGVIPLRLAVNPDQGHQYSH